MIKMPKHTMCVACGGTKYCKCDEVSLDTVSWWIIVAVLLILLMLWVTYL